MKKKELIELVREMRESIASLRQDVHLLTSRISGLELQQKQDRCEHEHIDYRKKDNNKPGYYADPYGNPLINTMWGNFQGQAMNSSLGQWINYAPQYVPEKKLPPTYDKVCEDCEKVLLSDMTEQEYLFDKTNTDTLALEALKSLATKGGDTSKRSDDPL